AQARTGRGGRARGRGGGRVGGWVGPPASSKGSGFDPCHFVARSPRVTQTPWRQEKSPARSMVKVSLEPFPVRPEFPPSSQLLPEKMQTSTSGNAVRFWEVVRWAKTVPGTTKVAPIAAGSTSSPSAVMRASLKLGLEGAGSTVLLVSVI